MAATNVEYASGFTALESLILHTLPNFGPHGDGIINNNFLLAYLKGKNDNGRAFQVLDGGLEFWNGLRVRNSTNFKWQGISDEMDAMLQDPNKRLRFDIKTFTGSITIAKIHEAMNKGRAMIKNWVRDQREQAEDTIPNQFNSAFWSQNPSSLEPISIPSIVSTTPTTGTIGGLSRAGEQALQNGVLTTAVSDIGSEQGVSAMKKQQIQRSIGQGGKDRVDIIIMDEDNFAGLQGYLTTQNRFRPSERMAKLDFDTIQMGSTTISYENTLVADGENTIVAGRVYGLNSNHLKFKVLRDGNFIWNPDGFERVGRTLNKALYFWVFCNLTTDLPKAHFVMTNVSTA